MNLKLIQWLIKHRDVLMAVIEAAKKFDRSADYMSQWSVVDQIARIVIPVFAKEGTDVRSLSESDWEEGISAFAVGAEVSALGVDWQALLQIVLPILIGILKSLTDDE